MKEEIRNKYKIIRKNINFKEDKDDKIEKRLFEIEEFKNSKVICIYLTDTYKKQVFLEEAEKELLKQYSKNNDNNNLEMPDLFN